MLDAVKMATLARLFRLRGTEIKRILSSPTDDPVADAKLKIKETGRTPEDLVPLLSLPPGQAKEAQLKRAKTAELKGSGQKLDTQCWEVSLTLKDQIHGLQQHLAGGAFRYEPLNARLLRLSGYIVSVVH